MGKYFGEWDKYEDVVESLFQGPYDYKTGKHAPAVPDSDFPSDADIVFAVYDASGYEGTSQILFMRDGKLFEDTDAHCSCYGLDWNGGGPVTWDALALRDWDREHYLTTDAREAVKALIAENATPAATA